MMDAIVTLLGQYAFPVVMCVLMGWYLKYQNDQNREDINNLNTLHRDEMKQVSNAVNQLTLAIQKLTDYITGIKNEDI